MHPPKTKNRLTGFEHLEAREVPAASPLADLNTAPAPSFDWFLGTSSGDPTGAVVNGVALFAANDGVHSASVWKSDGTAAGTKMVAALPSAPGGVVTALGRPNQFTAAGGKAFFAYDDGTHGNTVWATDGTAAGTRMVADPTALGTSPWPTLIGAVGGRMLFSMTAFNSALPTARLYSSDGTAAGTTLVKDLGTYSNPSFTLAGNTLYFAVQTPPGAGAPPVTTLWKSDGTAAGTKTLADLPAGVSLAQGFFPGAPIAAVGNTVYFLGQDADHGRELWATDGTAAGTKLVKDLNTGPAAPLYPGGPVPPGTGDAAPQQLTAFGGKLYFVADDGTHGQELWSTDGTAAGTKMVTDLSPEVGSGPGAGVVMGIPTPSGSRVGGLRVLGGRLVFTADDGTHGPQVYGSDGTAAGTKALTAIEYAPLPADLPYPGYYPYTPPVLFPGDAGKATFSAEGGKDGPLFGTTDGTAAGTTTYSAGGFTGPVPVARLGGKLLLHADGPDGRQLRVTDGTAAGTKTVARINPNNLGSNPGSFVALNDKTAVFVGATGSGFATALYATDGVGTPKPLQTFDRPLPTLPIGLPGMTEVPTQLTRAGGKVFFLASAGAYGRELWVTDGTAAGTKMLKEVALPAAGAGFWGTYPAGLDNLTAGPNGTAYFTADAAGSGQQLWKTDGTAAGTVLVKQVNPASTRDPVDPTNPMPVGPVRQLTLVGNKLYFAAADGTGGDGLWTSDGTAAGTKRVAGLMTGPGGAGGSTAADFAAVGGRLVFTAPDGPGRKLWASDGTAAGTKELAALNAGSGYWGPGSTARGLVVAGGKAYFAARDDRGLQLWATDGTAAGTKRVSNLAGPAAPWGGPADPQVTGITAAGAKVYFTAIDAAAGPQLFVSDGTAGGTRKVTNLRSVTAAGTLPTPPAAGLAVGDKLLFAADDGEHGRELWVTDGTAAGTKMVQDIGAGTAGGVGVGYIPGLVGAVVNGRVVFAADTGKTGAEPWSVPLVDLGISAPTPPAPGPKPAVTAVLKVSATEGTKGLFTLGRVNLPAGPVYRVWVSWGDKEVSAGTLTRAAAGGTAWVVTGSHLYAAPGAYKAQFRVTADNKTVLTADTTAAVADARFYVGRTAERAVAGRKYLGPVATIQDLNPNGKASDFTATIDWGDGTTSAGTVRKTAAGRFEVVGDHTFAAPARRTVTVTIKSNGGVTATAQSLVAVDAARPPRV